jgi:hypothetical protein
MEVAAAAAGKPLTPEEEALRRSTDCVYFLASPLTCKKVLTPCACLLFYLRTRFLGFRPSDCWGLRRVSSLGTWEFRVKKTSNSALLLDAPENKRACVDCGMPTIVNYVF